MTIQELKGKVDWQQVEDIDFKNGSFTIRYCSGDEVTITQCVSGNGLCIEYTSPETGTQFVENES